VVWIRRRHKGKLSSYIPVQRHMRASTMRFHGAQDWAWLSV